jgi:hypothetical protein
VEPGGVRMTRVTAEKVITSRGYTNFELIYNGTANQAINLTYREYTPDDVARTAFYQNLTYDSKVESIRFRKLRIQIHSATNEEIDLTVLED